MDYFSSFMMVIIDIVTYSNVITLSMALALVGMLELDPITPYFTWLLKPVIPKTEKPIATEDTKNRKKEKSSRWKFWDIYYRIGLKNNWRNFFLENKLIIPQITVDIVLRLIVTSTFGSVMKALTSLSTKGNTDIWTPYLYVFMALMIFNLDVLNLVNIIFHESKVAYRNLIVKRIMHDGAMRMYSSQPSLLLKHNSDSYSLALPSYSFGFEDITDNISDFIVQFLRTLLFFVYIMSVEPRIFVPFLISYNVVVKKLVPLIMYDPAFRNMNSHWKTYHYNVIADHGKAYNPTVINTVFENKLTGTSSLQVISDEYSNRVTKMARSNYYLSFVKGCIVFGMTLFACQFGRYDLALHIIMSGRSVFEVVDIWVKCQQIQSRADRNMNKMLDILDAIDANQNTSNDEISPVFKGDQFSYQTDSNTTGISQISFDSMVLKFEKDTHVDPSISDLETNKSNEEKRKVSDNIMICVPKTQIVIENRKITLLNGPLGCGKTSIFKAMAGMSDDGTCETSNLKILFNNGEVRTEFDQIRSQRYIILQFMTEMYLYNGNIRSKAKVLFPGANNIEEIRDFLITAFKLKPTLLPTTLDGKFTKNLSGGERQCVVVAIQFWMIMKIPKTQRLIIMLDEIFRSIDDGTALHIMNWILSNVDAYFFVIEHLPEVKTMIRKSPHLDGIWDFVIDDSNPNKVNVVIN